MPEAVCSPAPTQASRPNIVFAGTPEFARVALEHLIKSSCYPVSAVYTQPDRPAGRGLQLQPSPVKQLAQQHQIPVLQPVSLRSSASQAELAALKPDLMIVAAYGLILPQSVLDLPRLGCINIHASLLPRWRGAAPIQRAIEAGDAVTGICIMQMEAGLDTGPVLHRVEIPIAATDTSATLHDKLATLGGVALLSALPAILGGSACPVAQASEGVTYAHKISKKEAVIDWRLPAPIIERRIRAFNPFPGCSFSLAGADPTRLIKCWASTLGHSHDHTATPGTVLAIDRQGLHVSCGQGSLILSSGQIPGGKRLTGAAWEQACFQGLKLKVGDRLAVSDDV